MSSQRQHHSELPKVWISFDHGPAESGATFVDEGSYPRGNLPFEVDDSAGIHFKLDGMRCELLGDLHGHAVYRRSSHPSAIYTMTWEDFEQSHYDGIIELNN